MTEIDTTFAEGIIAANDLAPAVAPSPAITPGDTPLAQEVKNLVRGELSNFLDDVEFRLAQTADINRRTLAALESLGGKAPSLAGPGGQVYAEDMNIARHVATGYTVTSNSPVAGSIAWASLHVVYNGTDYTLTNGNTALKYTWFDGAVSTTVAQSSNSKPTLAGNAVLLFVNEGGTVREAHNSSMPPALGNNAVDSGALQVGSVLTAAIGDGQITGAKTSFYTTLAAAVTAAQSAADLAQATADGSISTYYQSNPPWADGDATAGGASNPASKIGDMWYDQDDGNSYRWTGATGTPTNTWRLIEDSSIAAALAAANAAQNTANVKTTTFYNANAAVPTALTIGDFWVVTDKDNLIRRASAVGTANWVDVQIGTQAIKDGAITDVKVPAGANINGNKLLGSSVGSGQLGAGAVTPVKLNFLQHVIY